MSGCSISGRRRLIDTAVKARFLAPLRAGARREEAAAAAGFPLKSLYGARRRDPLFRLAWTWAMELSTAGQRPPAPAMDGDLLILPANRRQLQRRRVRSVRFTAERQRLYLDHFAGTADAGAAAAAAGVHPSTVTAHRRKHPEFAAAHEEALQEAYVRLEGEALRQRLAAQRDLVQGLVPAGEISQEFDRVMKLLARWDRRGEARPGRRGVRHGRQQAWSFEEAIALLDKRLRALGVRRDILAPPPPAQGA
jgi:hypothetical protein